MFCFGHTQLRIPDGKSPRFPKKPTIRQDGDILIMECVLEAHPIPDITWYQGEKSVIGSERIKMSRKAVGKDSYVLTLQISNPTRDDGGNYRCNAFNIYGESNANIALNFQGTVFVFLLIFQISLPNTFHSSNNWFRCVALLKICSDAPFRFDGEERY